MDFRRRVSWIVGQGLLFACGCGLVLAVEVHLYACAAVLLLMGVWIGASVIWSSPAATQPLTPLTPLAPSGQAMQWRLVSSVLDQIPAPLVLLEPDGRMKAANRAARRLFRVDDRILDPPASLREAAGLSAAEDRLTVAFEVSGETRTYAMSMIDLAAPEGVTRIAMLMDIQSEIRTAEATALRDLMQVLSHEIMNALTPVASLAATAVDLLKDGAAGSVAAAQGAVEILARRAEGLSRFVDAYRTLARLPSPSLEPASVTALLDEAAHLFRGRWAASGATLVLTRPDPDIVAAMDFDQMVHALINILSNAADAALSHAARPPVVELAARRRDGGVALVVADSGPGVPAGDRERIFQPFFTTKAEGTGVGLSFARQVALSHGGDLVLAPDAGSAGARFELSF